MVVSIPFLEARLRICYREVLCYYKLHILKLWCYLRKRLTFQGQFFSEFFLFHIKPSIAILTTVSKKNIKATTSYLLKRIFELSVNQPKVLSRQNTLVLGIQSRKHLLISVAHGDLCYLSAYITRLWMGKAKKGEWSFGKSPQKAWRKIYLGNLTRRVKKSHRKGLGILDKTPEWQTITSSAAAA